MKLWGQHTRLTHLGQARHVFVWGGGGAGSPTQWKGSRDTRTLGMHVWGSVLQVVPAVRALQVPCITSHTSIVCDSTHTHRTTGYTTSSSLAECADTACTGTQSATRPLSLPTAVLLLLTLPSRVRCSPNRAAAVRSSAQRSAAAQQTRAAVTRCASHSAAQLGSAQRSASP